MCELGEKPKNVGKRLKAGQKLNRKIRISETRLKSGQGQGQGVMGIFSPGAGIFHGNFTWDPRRPPGKMRKKKEKKESEEETFVPGPLFLSAALKAGDGTQNRMRKVLTIKKYRIRRV